MSRKLFVWAVLILLYWLVADAVAYLLGIDVSGIYWVFGGRPRAGLTSSAWVESPGRTAQRFRDAQSQP